MKRRLSYMMMVILSAVALASCNQEVIQDNNYGYLGVSLDSDSSEDILTKADADELVFSVDVLNASGNTVASREDHRTITKDDPIKLQVGTYTVAASSGENLNAAFDNPYYEGKSDSFRINPNKTTSVNLTCTLANTIVSVEFPGDFSKFTDYEVAVTNGKGDKLVFSNKPQAGSKLEAPLDAKAYFAVTGTLTWELYLKNTDGGEYHATGTYEDVKAKQHYHLKFAMGEDETADGGFTIKIGLDNSWEDTEHEVILDFSKKNMPSVTSNEGFSAVSGESVPVPVGNDSEKVLSFKAAEGVRSLRVSHENDALLKKGLPNVIELVGATSSQMDALKAAGISVYDLPVKSIDANSKNIEVDLTGLIASLEVGSYGIDFTFIDTKGRYDVFELMVEVISDVDAEAVAARTGWAAFAQLEGRFFVDSKKDVLTFQYKKASASEWIEVDCSEINVNTASKRYSTILFGLEPDTEYVFRAVSDVDKDTKQISFTTAAAGTLHNLDFDSWTNDDMYPNASGYDIWDSANSSGVTITTKPTSDAVSGKAARLESITYMGMMAAGNIFTGQFAGVAGLGAKLDWGVPFNARPIAMRGYYKYAPKKIDAAKAPYKDMKGQIDQSQILVFLTDWSGTFRINTSNKEFVDLDNDPGIIALGQQNTSDTDSGYVKFTLPLVYRDATRIPNYIVIAAASSRYGDYFTGGVGSVLYVDEFELIYDPAELTEEEFNTVFSKVNPF